MNAILDQRREPIPQLRDICPQYAEACEAYERAMKTDDEKTISNAFRAMSTIATVFWQGVDYATSDEFRSVDPSRIRVWRAGG